jgi:hypothetical protein
LSIESVSIDLTRPYLDTSKLDFNIVAGCWVKTGGLIPIIGISPELIQIFYINLTATAYGADSAGG